MNFRRAISASFGIVLVLFVAFANIWSAPQRAAAEDQIATLTALGFSASDICGDMAKGHAHCPLCRMEDTASVLPRVTSQSTGLTTASRLVPTPIKSAPYLQSDHCAQPRAPPFTL